MLEEQERGLFPPAKNDKEAIQKEMQGSEAGTMEQDA
jgi:hypothetical protein